MRCCHRDLEEIGIGKGAEAQGKAQTRNEQKPGARTRHADKGARKRAGDKAENPIHFPLQAGHLSRREHGLFHVKSVITDQTGQEFFALSQVRFRISVPPWPAHHGRRRKPKTNKGRASPSMLEIGTGPK